jgi:outer membrane lipoprotein SlyB
LASKLWRAILVAALLALGGCQLDEPTVAGTVVSVMEAEHGEARDDSGKYDEPPLVPEVAWQVEVRLDDGSTASVMHDGRRRYAPGDRVRLLIDQHGALLL